MDLSGFTDFSWNEDSEVTHQWVGEPPEFFLHGFLHKETGVCTDFSYNAPNSRSNCQFAPRETLQVLRYFLIKVITDQIVLLDTLCFGRCADPVLNDLLLTGTDFGDFSFLKKLRMEAQICTSG